MTTANAATIWTDTERAAWRLPEPMTVTEWADRNRVLDPDTTADAGQYHSERTPYMRGVMDAFGDEQVEEITVMSGSQVGKSCSIQNMIGYIIDQDPAPTMYVVPREPDVIYASHKIFQPMVRLSPMLREHTGDSPRDLQTQFLSFDRMTLYFGAAGSPAEMAQKAIKNLFFDEPDKYPPFAGREASPIDLAIERTTTFWDRKIVKVCTPTTKTGPIYVSYMRSNQQEYYIPCLRCGECQVWRLANLKLPPSLRDPDEIRSSGDVWYECPVCRHKIYEDEKAEPVAAGIWVPAGQTIDNDGNIKGRPEHSRRHSGFQISALVSPWKEWPEIMARWFDANTAEGIAVGKLMHFQNATLGEPAQETGKELRASDVKQLRGGFSKGTVPADAIMLVAGADYHKSQARKIVRIDYEIRAFGYNAQNWVVKAGSAGSFAELEEEVLLSPFPWADGADNQKRPWPAVSALFIDSGFEPNDVYEFCRQRPGLTIPTKGEQGPRLKPLQASDVERATARRLGAKQRKRYKGMQLMLVDTYFFKELVTSWVEAKTDEEGQVVAEALTSFYDEIPSYYFTEFTNEQKVRVRDTRGNYKWQWLPVKKGAPVHSLDTAVLCAAAAFYKGALYLKRRDERPKRAAVQRGRQRRRKIGRMDLQR